MALGIIPDKENRPQKPEIDSSPQPIDAPERQLFSDIKESLATLDPEHVSWMKHLFKGGIQTHEADTVAIRSQDIFSTLEDLIRGTIHVLPHERTASFMAIADGWYYATPVYSHPIYSPGSLCGSLREAEPLPDLRTTAEDNANRYANTLAFASAFFRCITPHLPDGWIQQVRHEYAQFDPTVSLPDYPDDIYEELVTFISDSFQMHADSMISLDDVRKNMRVFPGAYLMDKILDLSKLDHDLVYKYLGKVARRRGGIMIAFNKSLLENATSVVNQHTPGVVKGNIIHDSNEIAIRPTDSKIDLRSCMCAVEPLGEFEENVATKLGLSG